MIKKMIIEKFFSITSIKITDFDRNLLADQYHIPVVEFLYIFGELENEMGEICYKIFEICDYEEFTVNGLAKVYERLLNNASVREKEAFYA